MKTNIVAFAGFSVLVVILVIILFTLPKGHYGQGARAFEIHTPPV